MGRHRLQIMGTEDCFAQSMNFIRKPVKQSCCETEFKTNVMTVSWKLTDFFIFLIF